MTDRELEELKHDVRKAVAVHVGDSDTWFPEVYALIQSHVTAKAVPGEDEVSNTIKEIDSWNDILKGYELPPDYLVAVERLKQEVNKSFATLHAQIARARDDALREAADIADKLIKNSYNSGFIEGTREYMTSRGGIPWNDSKEKQTGTSEIRSLITTPAPENGNGPVP